MEQKITDLGQIARTNNRGAYLNKKDFSDTDLSGINLSVISSSQWKNAVFQNTNLSNTKIKFYPRGLKRKKEERPYDVDFEFSVENCNFEGTDLSYLIKILKPNNKDRILTLEEISKCKYIGRITFTPVCVKGGLDSKQKILEYITKSFEIGIRNILISSLHKDAC